ncbi:MAG TPA: gluconate 2-dehydrogenase subunit 3 family protein [Candidatus Acidoferrales bacterium]|jgi:gluconate 2-dehydrogenase gamma chain|nr:gluconate 2-dehydrogenase subunit 3 family protein [Candidatus Acidoferrales bacterium]
MQRRELFRLLGAGAALPVFDSNLLAMFQDAHPKSSYTLRTLNPHQNATVVAMIDLIIPETDTPGAKAVGVNEFIDLILTDWAHDDERKSFLSGLDDVDKRSNAIFGKNFIDVTPAQQEILLRELDQRYAMEREERATHPFVRRPHNAQLTGDFFEVVKRMTLYGYYTSEVGFTKELRKQIIPGVYHGCTPVTDASKA